MSRLGAAALDYVVQGFAVFPCRARDKRPLTNNGYNGATKDSSSVEAWWRRHPNANVGIATGEVSDIFVLDIDVGTNKDGEETLRRLEAEHGPLPKTVEAITGSGGRHLFFQYFKGVQNSVSRLGNGLDVRSDGGHVVAPPSIHPDGGEYRWREDHGPEDLAPAAPPPWLVQLARSTRTAPIRSAPVSATIPAGQRNDALTRLAGVARRYGCDEEEIFALIAAVNARRCDPPLPEREMRAIAQSVGRYPPAGSLTEARIAEPKRKSGRANWLRRVYDEAARRGSGGL